MSSSPVETGTRLGKYEVLSHVATGGMGSVYKAVDIELRRTVALKVLPKDVAQSAPLLERLHREARNMARLSHPNIVTLFECGFDPDHGLHYLAMEFIDGVNLFDYIGDRGQLQPEEARRILLQVVKALDHAFSHGVVHRDIKPANILLAQVDQHLVIKLTDLGLARREQDGDFKVTREGSTVGTIDYMAPEQARDSGSADIRSDIYSLGCTAYHMLAGKAPFADGGLGERVFKHLMTPPADVRQSNPAVSARFWALLQKMLAKNPAERHATPRELFAALKATPADAAGEAAKPTVLEHGDRQENPLPPLPTKTAILARPVRQPKRQAPKPQSASNMDSAIPGDTQVTIEQARTAAAFHQRAVQVLAEGRGDEYARKLLANCLKLDPFNPTYRKTLRGMHAVASRSFLTGWLSTLSVLAAKSKMRLAFAHSDWRKVLDLGEEVLAHRPADVGTHLEMAAAAEKLLLPELTLWLLEAGSAKAPRDIELIRALANFHEDQHEWKRSVACWERVCKVDPHNGEARSKINDLSAQDLLANGHYTAG